MAELCSTVGPPAFQEQPAEESGDDSLEKNAASVHSVSDADEEESDDDDAFDVGARAEADLPDVHEQNFAHSYPV